MAVVSLLTVMLCMYGMMLARFHLRQRRLDRTEWAELLGRVRPVDIESVSRVAEMYLHPTRDQLRVEPGEMWLSIGSLQGLQALQANADAILDLATYACRWDRVEGRIIAEMIRRDGVRLKRAATRLELFWFLGVGGRFTPFHLQEVAAAYYLMRGRLLSLYELVHAGRLSYLADAL